MKKYDIWFTLNIEVNNGAAVTKGDNHVVDVAVEINLVVWF